MISDARVLGDVLIATLLNDHELSKIYSTSAIMRLQHLQVKRLYLSLRQTGIDSVLGSRQKRETY